MSKHLTDSTKTDGSPGNVNDITSTSDFAVPTTELIQKRPHTSEVEMDEEPPSKKLTPSIQLDAGFKWNLQALKQAATAVQSGGKSPVSALNELGVRVVYNVIREAGPAHCPNFYVIVTVADLQFEGFGHSKREARAAAAKACLSTLLGKIGRELTDGGDMVINVPSPQRVEPSIKHMNKQKPSGNQIYTIIKPELPQPSPSPPPPPAAPALFCTIPTSIGKSDINRLYEICPGLVFVCTHGDGTPLDGKSTPANFNHNMRFKVVCIIEDKQYEGYGSSKKLAKLAAARSALASMEVNQPAELSLQSAYSLGSPFQMLYDTVAKLVNEKFSQLIQKDHTHAKRKVLAGIVMTDVTNPHNIKVIAVTTGTKCINGSHMSVRGLSVNDTHAEVCARRCLQRHLYSELAKYASSNDPRKDIPSSDLEPLPEGGYRLRPQLQLHLYVSTAPCGDARIFSPHEPQPDRHPNRQARGQLRTKIESGEGTIPVKKSNLLQTWDGVLQGERLLTMSCSDKACKWGVVGLQGALLSTMIKPVYLDTIVLGALLNPEHMQRALFGRIERQLNVTTLPAPHRVVRPALARAASSDPRTPARAPNHALAWTYGEPHYEIINCTTGKLESGQPSLLCKQSMMARWAWLVTRLPQLTESNICPPKYQLNLDQILYDEAKRLAPKYQQAKAILYEAFDRAQLGKWVRKPLEQDQFPCELLDANPNALFT